MKPTAFLFDCDGVVLDTEAQYARLWARIGQQYRPDIPDFARRIKGTTLKSIYDRFFPDAAVRQAVRQTLDRYEAAMEYRFVAGADSFLTQCRAAGVPVALVTSSDARKMAALDKAIPRFCERFDAVFTAEDVTRSKPAPDCFIAGARHFGLEPEACVVFEDSPNGLQAARASGAGVVGLATSFGPEAIGPLCDWVVPNFSGLSPREVLRRFGRLGRV